MKIAIMRTIALVLSVVLIVGMLSGCKKDEMFKTDNLNLADTIWEYEGDYYVFYPDGTIRTYNSNGIVYEDFEGAYAVSGDICKMAYGSATYTVTKEDNELIAVDEQNETYYFTRVEHLPTPVAEDEPSAESREAAVVVDDPNALDLRNTTWETEGVSYHFYADGSVNADNGTNTMLGTYTWDGENGSITVDGATASLVIEDGELCILGEDGYLYTLVATEAN